MKLVTYSNSHAADRFMVGIIDPEAAVVYPIDGALHEAAPDMLSLIAQFDEIGHKLHLQSKPISVTSIRLRAPIPQPRRNIFCVGKNYRDHAREFSGSGFDASNSNGSDIPDAPILFSKATTSVIGPDDLILPHKNFTTSLDYEAELAVVIGRGGRGITRTEALAHVFGYMILNDITARDLQYKHKQWLLGKSLDTFCPIGPWIETADAIQPELKTVRCWVNGELRQEASVADLIFDIPSLIETLSAGITLQPGDIIATGTPAGVGIGFKPPRYLQSGDRIDVTISGLGKLTNTVG